MESEKLTSLNMPSEAAGLFALELGHPAVVVDLLMRGEMHATAAQLLGGHWKQDHYREQLLPLEQDAYQYQLRKCPIASLRYNVFELLLELEPTTNRPVWHLFRVQ